LSNFAAVLRQANKIVYAPPKNWSDQRQGQSKMQQWSEDYLNVFRLRCEVENFTPKVRLMANQMLGHADKRKSQEKQLWIAGCSVSHGTGVTNQTRYGQLLANQLKLSASFLTCPGSSILWAADQILRSDVRTGDIVVWGLTSWSRTPFFHNNKLYRVHEKTLEQHSEHRTLVNPDMLTSDHLFYQSLISIFQVINFCQKTNVQLVIASLLDDCLCQYLKDQSNFIMLYNLWGRNIDQLFVDLGNDELHPGIATHQFYCDQIYLKIQELVAHS
jgi:hypothetical protein